MMRAASLLIFASLAVVVGGCGGSNAPTLPVTVVGGSGVPLSRAQLYLANSEEPIATTDDLGIARLSLAPGVYLLVVNAEGHASAAESVAIKEGDPPDPVVVQLPFVAPEGYFGRYLGDHVWETLAIDSADPLSGEWSRFKYNQYESWAGGDWTCEWETARAELRQEGNVLVGGDGGISIVGPGELDASWKEGKILGDVAPPVLACPDTSIGD